MESTLRQAPQPWARARQRRRQLQRRSRIAGSLGWGVALLALAWLILSGLMGFAST